MAETPIIPRSTCSEGFLARSPVAMSPRQSSQPMITGRAKNERKNTASPVGTLSAALISEDMITNRMTEAIFSAMPRSGVMGAPGGIPSPHCDRSHARVQ